MVRKQTNTKSNNNLACDWEQKKKVIEDNDCE